MTTFRQHSAARTLRPLFGINNVMEDQGEIILVNPLYSTEERNEFVGMAAKIAEFVEGDIEQVVGLRGSAPESISFREDEFDAQGFVQKYGNEIRSELNLLRYQARARVDMTPNQAILRAKTGVAWEFSPHDPACDGAHALRTQRPVSNAFLACAALREFLGEKPGSNGIGIDAQGRVSISWASQRKGMDRLLSSSAAAEKRLADAFTGRAPKPGEGCEAEEIVPMFLRVHRPEGPN